MLPILGEQTGRFFRQAFTLEIAGDKLPAEQVQPLLDELQALFAKYQASEALKVKEGIKPVRTFTERADNRIQRSDGAVASLKAAPLERAACE